MNPRPPGGASLDEEQKPQSIKQAQIEFSKKNLSAKNSNNIKPSSNQSVGCFGFFSFFESDLRDDEGNKVPLYDKQGRANFYVSCGPAQVKYYKFDKDGKKKPSPGTGGV
jgi:hypothetical protein